MTKPKVAFYFDPVSPFAYIAFHIIRNSPIFKQCEITYVPIFLGALMHRCNNRAPLVIHNKGAYVNFTRLHYSSKFNVPMHNDMPPNFPLNTLQTDRALVAISQMHPEQLEPAIAALFDALFVHHRPIDQPDVIIEVLAPVFGGEGAVRELLAKGGSAEVKKLLAGNTDKAFDSGAFGVPWLVGTDTAGKVRGFWGVDSLGLLVEHLGLERPKDSEGWKSLL